MIDLHTHTTASDGQHTPREVVRLAAEKGISLLAVTDHDSTEGVPEARREARKRGIGFVAGIEISTQDMEEIHILGYGIDVSHQGLRNACAKYREARAQRGQRIKDFLTSKGVEIDLDEVRGYAQDGSLGRPHFAQYLQNHGIVATRKEAFDKYLDTKEFREATDREKPAPETAIDLIHQAGGKAVLAHPGIYRMNEDKLRDLIRRLVEAGLDGIECFYSRHSSEQTERYLQYVREYGLKTGCGSDFHGKDVKPDISLGVDFDAERYGGLLVVQGGDNFMEERSTDMKKGKYDNKAWIQFLKDAEERKKSDDNSGKKYQEYEKEVSNSILEFEKLNAKDLECALKCYEMTRSTVFADAYYKTINVKCLKYKLSKCKVMIITANPIERAILHQRIIDNKGGKITSVICGTIMYYIFKWDKYWIAHIHQGQTGAEKDLGTSVAIGDALDFFTPNVIISLGVAFGIDYKTQNIGDVLVSRRLFPYSANKRDEDYVKPDRTQDKTIDDWLHVRLDNAVDFLDTVTYGGVLSGGSVISSGQEKDRICLGYTEADYIIGGEMEGNAVFQYTKRIGIPGVVIKGICDWGVLKNGVYGKDGEKGDEEKEEALKTKLQSYAMMQVVEKCKPLFHDKTLFASSKNNAVNKHLKEKYMVCLIGLIVSQLLLIADGICCLLYDFGPYNEYVNLVKEFLDCPYVLLAIPCALLVVLIIVLIHKFKCWFCE